MKTVFITGTSSGLGKATTKLFQSKGWKVIATMRNTAKGQDLAALDHVTVLPMDITNTQQIQDTVARAIALGGVDVVINNAAVGSIGPTEAFTDEHLNHSVQTNFLGAIKVSRAFLPYFREKKSGLFINITSMAGLLTFPLASLYIGVKHALQGWSEGMYYELKAFGIGMKIVAPGGIRSDFASNTEVMTHEAYAKEMDHFMHIVGNPELLANYTPAEEIAAIVYNAATDGQDKVHYMAGEDVKQLYERRLQIGAEASIREMEKIFLG